MEICERNACIIRDAYQYLLEKCEGLTAHSLDKYLECPKKDSLNDVFFTVVCFYNDWYRPKKKRLMYDTENGAKISEILRNGNFEYMLDTYTDEPQKLYDDLMNNLNFGAVKEDNYTQRCVKIYVNIICGMSKYLSDFSTPESLYGYFNEARTPREKVKLVHEIVSASKQVHYKYKDRSNREREEGWGFALASNWIKDIGTESFCKPDVHVKRFMRELKFTKSSSEEPVFRDFLQMAVEAHSFDPFVTAFKADRLAYLIGSGDFYDPEDYGKVKYSGSTADFAAGEIKKYGI